MKEQLFKKGDIVYWTDPCEEDGFEHTSCLARVIETPQTEDLEEDEIIYFLQNIDGGEIEAFHNEVRKATEAEKQAYLAL